MTTRRLSSSTSSWEAPPGDTGEKVDRLMCAATPDPEIGRRALDRTAMRARGGRASAAPGQSRCFGLELVAIGLDHTTAGIELRERLAFSGVEIPPALSRL